MKLSEEKFMEAIVRFRHWFKLHNIDTDKITLVIRTDDPKTAAYTEMHMMMDVRQAYVMPSQDINVREMNLFGIKFRLESTAEKHEPVHFEFPPPLAASKEQD